VSGINVDGIAVESIG